MIIKKIKEWFLDWVGNPSVIKKKGKHGSPFEVLFQVLAILAILFSGPILTFLSLSGSEKQVLIFRGILFLVIIAIAFYVVIAKGEKKSELSVIPEDSVIELVYKYPENDRLISKCVFGGAIILMAFVLWPKPADCLLNAEIDPPDQISNKLVSGLSLRVTGPEETNEFILQEYETSSIYLTPGQRKDWTIEVIGREGEVLGKIEGKKCISEPKDIPLPQKIVVRLRPR